MTTSMTNQPSADVEDNRRRADGWDDQEEHTTETRRSLVTSEFWIFVILSVAVLFFAYESGTDSFSRDDAWRYVTWLGIGYLLTPGLAKSGSYETFTRRRSH